MIDYKKMIIELLERINNEKALKAIYEFVHHKYMQGGK